MVTAGQPVFSPRKVLSRPYEWIAIIAVIVIIGAAVARYAFRDTSAEKLNAALASYDQNDTQRSAELADEILAKDPNNVSALLMKAMALAQQGSLQFKEQEYGQQAIAIAQQALALEPGSVEARHVIGYSYEIMQKYPEAHAAYAEALAIDPENAVVLSQDAHAWDLQGDLEKAEAGYRQALALEANNTQALMGLGRILVRKGDLDEAKDPFLLVAMVAQNKRLRAEGAYSASSILSTLEEHDAALEQAKRATETDPEYSLGWYALGKELFTKSVDLSQDLPVEGRQALGNESFNALLRAIEINPNQTLARVQLGMQFAALGRKDEAQMELEEAKRIVPNDITLSATEKTNLSAQIDAILAAIQTQHP